jgi:hypothetical protein
MNEEGPTPGDKIVAAPLEDVRKARGESLVAMPLEQVRSARGETLVALPRSKVASLRAFRRIRADRILGIIGLILVLIGILLIFTWEKPPEIVKKYGVEWPLTSEVLLSENATFTCNADPCGVATPYSVTVDQTNVTAVTFWLQWTDDVAGENQDLSEGDEFQLEFSGPEGTNISNVRESRIGGRGGMNMSFTYVLSGIPDIGAVEPADNDEEAFALIGDRTNRTGIGDWKFTVTLLRAVDDWAPGPAGDEARRTAEQGSQKCPDSPQQLPTGGATCTRDPGNSYTFGFQITRYSVAIEKQY